MCCFLHSDLGKKEDTLRQTKKQVFFNFEFHANLSIKLPEGFSAARFTQTSIVGFRSPSL